MEFSPFVVRLLALSYFQIRDYDSAKIEINNFWAQINLNPDYTRNWNDMIDELIAKDQINKEIRIELKRIILKYCNTFENKNISDIATVCDSSSACYNETIEFINQNIDKKIEIIINPVEYTINENDAQIGAWMKMKFSNNDFKEGYNSIKMVKINNNWFLMEF